MSPLLFSLYVSPLISLCISLPFPFFPRVAKLQEVGRFIFLDVIANFHMRSDKKEYSTLCNSVSSFICWGTHPLATWIFFLHFLFLSFFSRILHWLAHRNDFKVQINVFICWRLKYFLYLYPLTDQIRASPAVCGAAIDEAPIVLYASHQKSFLSYNDMLHKDKEQAFSSHEELKKKKNSNPRPIASYIVSCLFEGIR